MDRLLLIIAIILLERIYTYKYSVSQRAVLGRDIISNLVNLYVTGPATAMVVLPILVLGPEHILGRKQVFAAHGQLGPFWLQVAGATTRTNGVAPAGGAASRQTCGAATLWHGLTSVPGDPEVTQK
jgi:hypothetical protein